MTRRKLVIPIFIGCFILLMGIMLTVFLQKQAKSLDILSGMENTNYEQIAGALDGGTSIDHAISDVLKGIYREEEVLQGRALLAQYGFEKGMLTETERYIRTLKKSGASFCVLFGVLILLGCAGIVFLMGKKHTSNLEELLDILNSYSKGNFLTKPKGSYEKIQGKIYDQLERLGQTVVLIHERLEKDKKETESLVTDISHQLKTPLASLKTCFDIIAEEDLSQEEQEEFLARSNVQIRRLESLITALVNISRMETGLIHINKVTKDIRETVSMAINDILVKANEKKITLELKEGNTLVLPHDVKWTKEAIANILDNGVKYSPSGSIISLDMEKLRNHVRIEIRDEGIGILPQEYTEIFKRFYRGKTDTVKQQEGSGVGLYLTRKILDEQGGSIMVSRNYESQEEMGSKFVIQLPLYGG